MRIAFLGNDPWSVPSLEALAARGHDVALVVTNPPRPAGRGSRLTPTAVAESARALDLRLEEVEGVQAGAGLASLRAAAPEVLVVVAYGALLGPPVLTLAPQGAVNVHFSLLPRWRGAAPVQHALLQGDTTTGVSVMQMDAGLDTGPILAQTQEQVGRDDDAGSLGGRLAAVGGTLLATVLDDLATKRARARDQDAAAATTAPKLKAEDRVIDWSEDSRTVVRRIRAFGPAPGVTTSFRGEPIKVLRAEEYHLDPVPEAGPSPSGSLLVLADGSPLVRTAAGDVLLGVVAPAGRRHMAAADWARGVRIRPGERLV
jgi:methionyl-tRNA formyltransferase